mmetsp:Transcript_48049/g.35264  ORF Transcript_48049/g.35264 Transcript_48049/m.35264 type:complete len:94 (-) Transcript_48049:462-743(-)
MMRGERAQFLEANIDFIQKHLREYCLSYAASLVFVETQSMTNVELLYRYLQHRLYGYDFASKAQVYAKDQLFVPTGFDSLNLIKELCKDPNSE